MTFGIARWHPRTDVKPCGKRRAFNYKDGAYRWRLANTDPYLSLMPPLFE